MPESLGTAGFRSEPFFVDRPDGARIHGEIYLPPGKKKSSSPTVILVHGWTLNRTVWSRVIRMVHEEFGAVVVAYDQRAHGQSTPGDGIPSVEGLGDDLAAVIADTAPKGPIVLVGHSMGGMTVMAYCGLYPEQALDRVAGVVLVSTAAADVHRPGWIGRIEMGVMGIARHGPRIPAGIFVTGPHQRHLNFGDDPDPRDVALVRRAIAGTKIKDMGRYWGALRAMDQRDSLIVLGKLPTTILVGTKDRLTAPEYARLLHSETPNSRLVEIPGKGHMLSYEAPEAIIKAIGHAMTEGKDRTA